MSCNYPVNTCTEVYLIRHAEKDRTDPLNKNPHLNENGKERSLLWNGYFKNNKIDAIYSTNYNRTIETVLPISISKGIKPIIYSPSNINYDSFLKKVKGKTILVVGHSNTIPGFVNELIEEDYYEQINDTVNSNLYIVKKCPKKLITMSYKSIPCSNKILLLFILLLALGCGSNEDMVDNTNGDNQTTAKNNVLLIIADDLGLDSTSGYNIGNQKPSMPTIQKLINSGIKFNNVWSNPVCTPTRGTILTGKYGYRTSVLKVDDVLSTSEISIFKNLKNNTNYNSAFIGKWHLSEKYCRIVIIQITWGLTTMRVF